MKQLLLGSFLLISAQLSMAQLGANITSQDASCSYNNDGSITLDSIWGCFAPIEIQLDTNLVTINHLQNNAYDTINHGAGSGLDIGYSVWAGQTSIGPVYIATGKFANAISFGTTTLTSTSGEEMFTACFDANTSQLLWAHRGGAGAGTFAAGYAVTGAGDKAYVTGYSEGTFVVDGESISSAAGNYQAYIVKFDIPTGTVDTITQYGGTGVEEGLNIYYAANRIYLVGDYSGSMTLAGNAFTSAGGQDGFILCLDSALQNEIWSAAGGGNAANADVINDVVAYVNNGVAEKIFVVGEFYGSATFAPFTINAAGSQDFFVAEIDTNGNWQWVTNGGGSQADYCTSIDISSNGDKLYVAGSWRQSLVFDGQFYTANVQDDGFVGYMDTAGNLDTLYVLSGDGPDFIYDLKCVADDFILFSGTYGGTLNFADSAFVSNGNYDAFVGKIGLNQHEIWGKNLGSAGNDYFNSVCLGPNERYHLTGAISGNASAYQSGLISAGAEDVIVTNDRVTAVADTTIVFSGLAAGSYIIVYFDSNGNAMNDTVLLGPDSILLGGVVTNASSPTNLDGAIDLSVSGGVPGYTYLWSNGATTQDLDSIPTGTYCVTVTDTNGCMDSTCFFVDSSTIVGPMIVTAVVNDLACFGDSSGSIDLTVSGGITPYSYNWSNGATSQDLTGLAAGVYTVTVTDSDTSNFIDSFTVIQPSEIVITDIITPPSSGLANDGAIDISVSGGFAPYTFAWNTGDVSEDLDSLVIGLYTLTVTDSSGCEVVALFQVDTIPALQVVGIAGDVTCLSTNNGMVDITVIGGLPPFSFSWSNGATSEDISGLSAGIYTVTVTDSVAQTAVYTDSVGSNPVHPNPTVGPISGPASVQAWTSYNYSVPVSIGSSFDWGILGGTITGSASNAATAQWNGGPTGVIHVTETDANGCFASDSMEVSIIFVGVEESHENAVMVYPNPAADLLNVVLPQTLKGATVRLIHISGAVVYDAMSNDLFCGIAVDQLPKGHYTLQLQSGALIINHPVVVAK